jgi:hypothetical protein
MNRSQRRREATLQPKGWVPLERATPVPLTEKQIAEHLAYGKRHGYTEDQVHQTIAHVQGGEMWLNDRYQVVVRELEGGPETMPMVELSIRRIDRRAIRDWRDVQRIKNELVGPECEAVELYPAESRLVDSSNQYFIYAVLDPSFRFPWGFRERLVSSETSGGSQQRPFDEEVPR